VERYAAAPVYAEPPPPTYAPPPVAAAPQPVPQDDVPLLERYTLSARELFEFDRAVLRMPQPKLDEIAGVLMRNPQIHRVAITGYTDRIGTDSYNLKLSQRRADAVKSYLVGKGVAAIRLTAIGRGKANPVVECHQTSRPALIKCLEPNRRVEVEQITVERRIR
jgi:OOP family OmpA-OmpF porin